MVFYDASTEDAIVQEVWRITGGSANTYSLKAVTARVNAALDKFYTIAFENDESWQFDDTNNTDLPIAVADLVSGQQDYSFASELLSVSNILVKDSTGNFSEIYDVDADDRRAQNIWTVPTGNSGTPYRYEIIGNSILLDPIPNYASVGGLKVVFRRNASKFVSTDTTKVPGIPSLFHPYLARAAAVPFLMEKSLPQLNAVMNEIAVDEKNIETFISARNKTRRTKMVPKFRNPR